MAKEYAEWFYHSPAWKATRKAYFEQRAGQCERCLRELEEGMRKLKDVNPGSIVHHKKHITPKNIYNPKITLSFDNLELLCEEHHNKEHKVRKKRYHFDKAGNIVKN